LIKIAPRETEVLNTGKFHDSLGSRDLTKLDGGCVTPAPKGR
jgi:hypothetical protein